MSTELKMPALSPTMEKGNLAKWLKNVGDPVQAGDLIAEIETDKATMEYEAPEDGVLAKILLPAGSEDIAVGTVLALLAEAGENIPAETMPETVAEQLDEPEIAVTPVAAVEPAAVAATPLARRLAKEQGILLAETSGSGAHGRILKRDVEAERPSPGLAARASLAMRVARQGGLDVSQARAMIAEVTVKKTSVAAPNVVVSTADAPFEEVRLSAMRKVIAARLTASKQSVPHFYMTVDIEIDALLSLRKQINEAGDIKLSVNDFIVKALAKALIMVPEANVQYGDGVLRRFGRADISVAVAIDGGLVTPVVRAADGKSLAAISAEIKALAEKARAGKLLPEEYQGGTFSLSNLGMYGIKQFDAVINPPQAGILAIGAGEQRAIVKNGAVVIATVMSATLSVDHRAVDGAIGADLLASFKKLLEQPLLMLA